MTADGGMVLDDSLFGLTGGMNLDLAYPTDPEIL